MTKTIFEKACWIWSAEPGDPKFSVRRFRGRFTTDQAAHLTCHVSADSRYLLYLDGALVGRGPARSDLGHYVYDTYQIEIEQGDHVFAAIVSAYDKTASPVAEMHHRGGFLLEASAESGDIVIDTSDISRWLVQADSAYKPLPVTLPNNGYYAAGDAEEVFGAEIPAQWNTLHCDESGWEAPVVVCSAFLRGRDIAGSQSWHLIPRDIPHMRDEPRAFRDAVTHFPMRILAGASREVVLDAGEYAIGYPELTIQGGKGATVEMTYAEATTSPDGTKGLRCFREDADVLGVRDIYHPSGGEDTYSPLHWRAFRFVKLTIRAAEEPLEIGRCSYRLTGYPWQRRAEFHVENGPPELPVVMDVDFRTLERCTWETFMDCPYYEQLQYAGDTRLQALIGYVTTGDTRLGARAVRLFDWSRVSDGLTLSRYPSNLQQIIPPFSLLWILMVEDLQRYAPEETGIVAGCLTGCRDVLEWFRKHLNADGLLGALPWWNFVDWSWPAGVPPPSMAGLPSATLNLQYLAALQSYVRLLEAAGDTRELEFWKSLAGSIMNAIQQQFWDPARRLFREGTDASWGYTQHAQAWGILTDAVPDGAMGDLVESLHNDDTLVKTTFYHTFYVVEALAKAGRLEQLWEKWLAPWRDALDMGLTTWPEEPEPTRSDCHAWSAWPTYIFLTHVLGVMPGAAGQGEYTVSPKYVAGWDDIAGSICIPGGMLQVRVRWEGGKAVISSMRS